jgi:hypothetical protein
MCTFFLVVAFHDARFLSGLYGRFSYIVDKKISAGNLKAYVNFHRDWVKEKGITSSCKGNGPTDEWITAHKKKKADCQRCHRRCQQ